MVIGTGVARVLRLCDALKVPGCRDPEPVAARDARGSAIGIPDDVAQLSARETAGRPTRARRASNC